MTKRRFRRAGTLLLLATIGCGDSNGKQGIVRLDELTLPTMIGGDLLLVVTTENCETAGPLIISADDIVLGEVATPTIAVAQGGGNESIHVIQVRIAESNVSARDFGLPLVMQAVVEVACGALRVRSEPMEITYVPTEASMVPAFNPFRFWAGDVEGQIWACEGSLLSVYQEGLTLMDSIELGFSCAEAELRGFPGERRYLSAESLGLVALDPGPIVAWRRLINLDSVSEDTDRDAIIIYEEDGESYVERLDWVDGSTKMGAILLDPQRSQVGFPKGTFTDETMLMQSQRPDDRTSLSYYVQHITPSGGEASLVEIVHYPWNAPALAAEFSEDGEAVYVVIAPTADGDRWVEKRRSSDATLLWSTLGEPWRFVLGESLDTILVASTDSFGWLDAADGTLMGESFSTQGGNAFVRGALELDNSLVLLGDASGGLDQGFYVFDPMGKRVFSFNDTGGLFRWVTPGWDGGVLLSYFNELHQLYPRKHYESLLQTTATP
jgi:hypothetical protein